MVSREPPPFLFIPRIMKQPSVEQQIKLNDVLEDRIDIVTIGGKEHKVSWIKKGVIRKLTDTILTCKNEDELSARCASLVLLNGYWKIKLFHWIYWRYLWRKYSDEELFEVTALAKKKVDLQTQAYLTNTIYLIGMKDTMMTMTRKEAERTLQELRQEHRSATEKNIPN